MKKKAFSLCPVKVMSAIDMKIELEVALGNTQPVLKWFYSKYNRKKVRDTFVSKKWTFSSIHAFTTHALVGQHTPENHEK